MSPAPRFHTCRRPSPVVSASGDYAAPRPGSARRRTVCLACCDDGGMAGYDEIGPPLRLCFVGDELVSGTGDTHAQGWVARVLAQTPEPDQRMTAILPVARETTAELAQRWEAECRLRFTPRTDNRLIVGIGPQDLREGISLARSRLNVAKILDAAATARIAAFVVGPPPLPGLSPSKLAEFSEAFHEVCRRRSVPYVETFEPLAGHDQWEEDIAAPPVGVPGRTGHSLIAWLVLHNGWREWVGAQAE